jgi:hypothetical protein
MNKTIVFIAGIYPPVDISTSDALFFFSLASNSSSYGSGSI